MELLRGFDHDLDLPALFEHWNLGSVIRSWLVELMGHGLREGGIGLASHVLPGLDQLSTYVEDTGEVKWVIKWGLDRDIPHPGHQHLPADAHVLPRPRLARGQVRALLRNQHGGHAIHLANEEEQD